MKQCTIFVLLFVSILINLTGIQCISIGIENLEEIVSDSLDRLINEIDPTLEKSQNMSEEILIHFDERIKAHLSDAFHWLQVNLFFLLIGTLFFSMIILLLLVFLDMVLVRYEFKAEKRRFISLAVITLITIWLFIAITVTIWPSSSLSNIETLQYILFGLITALVLYLICVWICSIYRIRHRLSRSALEACGCKSYVRVAVQSNSKQHTDPFELKPATF